MRTAQTAPPWLLVPPEGYGGAERLAGNLTEGLVEILTSATRQREADPVAAPWASAISMTWWTE